MMNQKAMPAGPLRRSFSEASRQGFLPIIFVIIAGAVVALAGGIFFFYYQSARQYTSVPGTQATPESPPGKALSAAPAASQNTSISGNTPSASSGQTNQNAASKIPAQSGAPGGVFAARKTHLFGSDAENTGSELAGGTCSGSGSITLSVSPMKAEDISSITPYGWMINQHVTPIDHQYFAPAHWDSPRDSYEVRSPADGHITQIQHRTSDYANFSQGQKTDEYRVVIDYTCTFLSYFDLLTSLSPDIQSQVGATQYASVNIPVRAGQVIGKIGGQTLDFAVWDTTKTLPGFLVPDHYKGEPWKIHTADPLDYASPGLKAFMLSLNPRKVPPISGKIDYDIDGTLSGNWFLKGQGGYTGNNPNNFDYWKGQFAFAPNNYDPTLWEISSGAWGENGNQFAINSSQPKPDSIGVTNGPVKYELYQVQLLADGKPISNERTIKGNQTITAIAGGQLVGCMLVQLTARREMKAEGFPGQSCAGLNSFDENVKVYER